MQFLQNQNLFQLQIYHNLLLVALWTRYLTINPEEIEEPWDGEIRPIRLALRITSQCMNVYPSIENATTGLFNQLYAFHGIVSKQPRIVANRHQVTIIKIRLNTLILGNFAYRRRPNLQVGDSENARSNDGHG
jgi:hypothetical protein